MIMEKISNEKISPAMKQYQSIKARYPDAILFFHIGDFYETFGTDAELVSRELEIVLTSRSRGSAHRIPLAGVPYHSAEGYIAKLVGKGYKVAICDQLEDAKNAKGIVKRDVVRVITPGTLIDSSMLPSYEAQYLMSICPPIKGGLWGIAFLDISTGEFFVTLLTEEDIPHGIYSEISRYHPAECIVPSTISSELITDIKNRGVIVNKFRDETFDNENAKRILIDHFHVSSLAAYGCDNEPSALGAAAVALLYAKETQNSPLPHVSGLSIHRPNQGMILDGITLRNLEIIDSIRSTVKGSTLLSCLNVTKTAMGLRLLREYLTRPLTDITKINQRLDSVEYFAKRTPVRLSLRSLFVRVADLERIAARISYGNAGPRDLQALVASLKIIPGIKKTVNENGDLDMPQLIGDSLFNLKELPETIDLIQKAIIDDPPAIARSGGIIQSGYSKDLDNLKNILTSGKDWISELQRKEREKTGIKSLKIGYNKIFGYYIDVTHPNLHLVPDYYERKQTTASGERFTIPELKEKERLIINADERVLALERDLFSALIEQLKEKVLSLQATAKGVAALDVFCALAEVAQINGYIRPVIEDSKRIVIRDGRHPVVERSTPIGFVPNDTELSSSENQIMIITGANMAGKSTYMRAVALISIMAQAGSFVPATHATIGIIDRIFTRVGAFDDLSSGQSTFMVEMLELANILNNVTDKSLIILDEIGRGTSTVDGYAIAQSVLEYLHGKSQAGPKTLFATHFHELVNIENELKRVKNFHFAVKETKKEVIFLRKLIPGATDKSYGIHVARLAGIPKKVTDRADTVLSQVISRPIDPTQKVQRYTQLLLVDESVHSAKTPINPVIEEIKKINADDMTPIQALQKLNELKARLIDMGDDK